MTGSISRKTVMNTEHYVVIEPPESEFMGNQIDFKNLPRVSFCVPTLNNEETLEAALKSYVSQEYPDIEIIIVDGHSKDKTIEIAKRYTNKIYFDDGTLGSATQTAVEKSSGEIIVIIDSDIIIPHKKWLINAIRYFNYSDKVSTVWPMNLAPPKSSLTTRLYFNYWQVLMEDRIKKRRSLFGGGNSLLLRKYIDEIGGINRSIHWGLDFDWAQKLKDRGYQVVYIKDPIYHDTMRSLKEFTKKQFVGAKTFTNQGFQLMNLSLSNVLYEQFILGSKSMLKGLFLKRDISWSVYPIFVSVRVIAYAYTYLLKFSKS